MAASAGKLVSNWKMSGFLEIDIGDAVAAALARAVTSAGPELSAASTPPHLPATCRAKPPVEVKQSSAIPAVRIPGSGAGSCHADPERCRSSPVHEGRHAKWSAFIRSVTDSGTSPARIVVSSGNSSFAPHRTSLRATMPLGWKISSEGRRD